MTPPIFLHYDREALDREYNNRAKVPNALEMLDGYSRESAATRAALLSRLDLAYGAQPGERLDAFAPTTPPPGGPGAPIHLFIHGGYWQWLDKTDFSFVARAFAPAGAITVVINYALMPAVSMDELVRQCRAAAVWTFRNAPSLGGDRERLFVSGHSAGGHLVAMLLATDWPRFEPGLPAGLVKGGVAFSGLYDLEPIRLCYLNDTLKLSPDEARRNSPIHLRPAHPRPLLLAVGGLEGPEYHRQVEALARPWNDHGMPIEVVDQAGHDHFTIVMQLADPDSPLSRAARAQMGLA
jgi:arylformamidase